MSSFNLQRNSFIYYIFQNDTEHHNGENEDEPATPLAQSLVAAVCVSIFVQQTLSKKQTQRIVVQPWQFRTMVTRYMVPILINFRGYVNLNQMLKWLHFLSEQKATITCEHGPSLFSQGIFYDFTLIYHSKVPFLPILPQLLPRHLLCALIVLHNKYLADYNSFFHSFFQDLLFCPDFTVFAKQSGPVSPFFFS